MAITISGGVQLSGPVILDPTGGSSPTPTPSGATNFGYTSGGKAPPWTNVATIDKFPFASDGNATDVGDLSGSRTYTAGQSSADNGYASGGNLGSYFDIIDKFPFASDDNATNVGSLTQARRMASGQSSTDSGYTSGGQNPSISATLETIDKFPFASDGNATDVGDLSRATNQCAGQSSSTSGYISGGLAWVEASSQAMPTNKID